MHPTTRRRLMQARPWIKDIGAAVVLCLMIWLLFKRHGLLEAFVDWAGKN